MGFIKDLVLKVVEAVVLTATGVLVVKAIEALTDGREKAKNEN